MASSAEIAQQIADQQNWFMQQNAMAAQVGVNPMAYGGLSGWGMAPSVGAPVMPGHPGMAPMPGAFSYGGGYGYGAGNRFGAAAAGGLSALPMMGGMALGLAGSPLGDPISGFMAMRGMRFGLGASMAGAGAMMLPMAAAQWGVGQMVTGAQEQGRLNTAISNYNFANPASATGMGFSRMDAQNIGRQVRQLSVIPELMTSFDEISRILPQLKQMGMMNGVRDASEFGRRMKEAITTVREVSKVIGSTMEEATEFFAHSRRVGFLGGREALQNAMNARITMGVTGMNQQQFMNMQEQGAAMGTAIGGYRGLGATAVTNIAQRIGLTQVRNPGLMETIANITGRSDEQGIADASTMIANLGLRVAGTGPGRFMLAGLMKVGPNGEATLDDAAMDQYLRGGTTMGDLRRRGMQMMGNRRNVISFETHQTKLAQQFTARGGTEAMLGMLQEALGTDTEAARYVLQSQFGATEQQADLVQELLRGRGGGVADEERVIREIVARQSRRREAGPSGFMKRAGTAFERNVSQHLKQAGADMTQAVGRAIDEVYEDWMGDTVLSISNEKKNALIQAFVATDKKAALSQALGGAGLRGEVGSASAGLRRMLSNTELGAWWRGVGTSGSGYSKGQLEERFGGAFNAVAAGGFSPEVQAEIAQARSAHGFLLQQNSEYMNATPDRQAEMLAAQLDPAGTLGENSAGMKQLMAKHGYKGALNFLAIAALRPDRAAFMGGGADVSNMTRDALQELMRTARSGAAEYFGAGAAGLENSGDARALLRRVQGASGEERTAILEALKNNDGAALEKLTGRRFNPRDMDTVKAAVTGGGAFRKGAMEALATLERGLSTEASMYMKDMMTDAATGAQKLAESTRAGGATALSQALMNFSDAATAFGGRGDAASLTKLNETIDAAAAALEAMPDAQRRDTLAAMPGWLQTAVGRRAAVKGRAGLAQYLGKTVSLDKVSAATGLSKEDISKVLNLQGVSEIQITEKTMQKLATEAGHAGAGRTLVAGQEKITEKFKEDAQMVLLKTMTEALVAIADKDTGGKFSKEHQGAVDASNKVQVDKSGVRYGE